MTSNEMRAATERLRITKNVMDDAATRGIILTPADFTFDAGGSPLIDGMDANEWLDAMTMD